MTAIEGYVEYKRRAYCKDIACPVQSRLDGLPAGSEEYEKVRGTCRTGCVHTTWEFHHWLIGKGYVIVRPAE
jgi:hypothetical protein